MANILSIGQTALNAAQVGLATTGHNIANASTPGYSRQLVLQTTPIAQSAGTAFVGSGTAIATVKRAYDEYLNNQVLSAQTSQSELTSYYSQIQQVNNLFADPTSGLSPTLQNFFATLQNVAASPTSGAARQTFLAGANTLTSQFQSLDGQISEIRDGINGQIKTSIGAINTYSVQIAALNDAIGKAQLGSDLKPANDLLDQRDQVISDLSKQIQISVVKQENSYNIFIGNGQPLVVDNQSFTLAPIASPTDLSRTIVGYQQTNGPIIPLAENSISGGVLGGLFDFRSQTLNAAQNSLGRIAIGMATTFNAQHVLGQDQNGSLGGALFNVASPLVTPANDNTSTANLTSTITDVNALTTSDYRIQYDGANYIVTQLSDNTQLSSTTLVAAQAAVALKGFDFNVVGAPAAGDEFLIRPTVLGASGMSVAITDTSKIAVAAPIRTAAGSANSGAATISPGVVDSTYTNATVTPSFNLTYNSALNELSGFPALLPVTVNNNGTSTVFAAGTPVTYTDGATISFGGASFTLSGTPVNGDTFNIGRNTNGSGDSRNAVLLGALQSANTLANGTSSYQSAYGQMVNAIGNKTRELEVTSMAASQLLTSSVNTQQSVSGVNLDEEATNLLRYQQAYQAAGKVMQTAGKMFDVLLSLGN